MTLRITSQFLRVLGQCNLTLEGRAEGEAEGRVGDKEGKAVAEKEKKREKQLELAWQEHAKLSFTACYRDDCLTHRSAKEGARYFPKEPRNDLNKE